MPKFRKTILAEDRDYHSPDGVVSVNPENKAHWAAKVGEFISQGFDIPVFWDHPEDPSKSAPVKRKDGKRRRAKGQAGWLVDAKVDADGGLDIELDVPSKDAKQLEDNLSKVSPVLWDKLTDGRKQTHENVIGAVDLVVHPVDDTQTDFVPSESIACSTITRFSLDTEPVVYRLADLPDEFDKDKIKDEAEEPEEMEEEEPEELDTTSQLIEALAKLNVILSPDTTKETFQNNLLQALLTLAAQDGMGGSEQMEETTPEFAALSLERAESEKHRKFADKQHREGVTKRLSLLLESGKCTPAEAKAKGELIGAIRLALDDEGEHQATAVEQWIESREPVPEGTFWTPDERKRLSQLEEVPHPSHVKGDVTTDEEADEAIDEFFKK